MFRSEGVLYRKVNETFRRQFDLLVSSGLYDTLVADKLLVPHESDEIPIEPELVDGFLIRPELVSFISYPYEWSFSQYRDAALTTLEIQRRAIDRGMSLKDASAYNIQFHHGKPTLIDTLSFEEFREGEPWIAYGQFCRHFLAPLALMALVDVRLSSLMRANIDGIPLDLAARILGSRATFRMGLLAHIKLHAKASLRKATLAPAKIHSTAPSMSRTGMLALIDNLKQTVQALDWKPSGTQWANYYEQTNYATDAEQSKHEIVSRLIDQIDTQCGTCWDLGANLGEYSRIASSRGFQTIAWDMDPAAVEKAYRNVKRDNETRLLPLLQDLTNPSPSLGWSSEERDSFISRGPAGFVMALALIHHIAIGNNVPLESIAGFLASISKWAIVEFVPKEDSQVQRLLSDRADIFGNYHLTGFESAFGRQFELVRREQIPNSLRVLYLLKRIPD